MCGRYTLFNTLNAEFPIPKNMVGENYNIAPSSNVPVVIDGNNIKLVRWTFRVSWAEKLHIINARSETLAEKKIFKKAKRCIFIANGYFEWLRMGGEKPLPYFY